VNLIAIAQGSSETNISFVVDDKSMQAALRVLHRELVWDTRRELAVNKNFVKRNTHPLLAALQRLHHGGALMRENVRRVFVFRRIAAANMPALQAQPQMGPTYRPSSNISRSP